MDCVLTFHTIRRQRCGLAPKVRWPWGGIPPRFPKHSVSSVLLLAPCRLSQELVPMPLPGLTRGKQLELQGL